MHRHLPRLSALLQAARAGDLPGLPVSTAPCCGGTLSAVLVLDSVHCVCTSPSAQTQPPAYTVSWQAVGHNSIKQGLGIHHASTKAWTRQQHSLTHEAP